MCDLTRIGMRELFNIRVPIAFPPEQINFLCQVQDECFDSCMTVSHAFREGLKHGWETLADTWLCVVAHDISRVLIHYVLGTLGSFERHSSELISEVRAALQVNVQTLDRLRSVQTLAHPLVSVPSSL